MRKHFKFKPKKGLVFKDLQIEIRSDKIIKRSNNVYFEVKCLSCGKEYEKSQHSFFGRVITKCQCHKQNSSGYKGFEDISSIYFNHIRVGAESRGLIFQVSKEDMWKKYLEQNKKCALTGLPILIHRNARKRKEMTASLDRIDSLVGYTPENIQWLHKDINKMKMNFSEEYLLKLCKLIVQHNEANCRNNTSET